jgi:cyclase
VLTKRIIPCLDIKNGRTVKGVNFVNLRDAGDPVELAAFYSKNGADELVFLDISATEERRKTLANLVLEIAATINIPFTVGGGVSSIADVSLLLYNGADKVAINSAAVKRPELINDISRKFGSQCLVVAVDAKQIGAGEILFTSMDHDGTKNGFANVALSKISELVNIPVIASGGAGTIAHFKEVFIEGKADAALAASIFHFKEIEISVLKSELSDNGIAIRK